MRGDVDAGLDQRNAWRRRSLSRDGEKGFGDLQLAFAEINDAADFEHDDAWASRVECFDERAGAVGCQRRHFDDLAAAPPGGMCRPAYCARESERRISGRSRYDTAENRQNAEHQR